MKIKVKCECGKDVEIDVQESNPYFPPPWQYPILPPEPIYPFWYGPSCEGGSGGKPEHG